MAGVPVLTVMLALLGGSALSAQTLRVTVFGHYEYTGAAPSPTADFTLSFLVDRHPGSCGGTLGGFIACGASAPSYNNGLLHTTLGIPSLLFFDDARKGGLALYQSDVALNRLGFRIGSPQLFSGTLAAPSLLTGVFPICPAHFGQVDPRLETDLCSFASQGFASGDPINNPFYDPITLQSDDPILTGTVTIAAIGVPEPNSWALLIAGFGVTGMTLRRRRARIST